MGFFDSPDKAGKTKRAPAQTVSVELLHKYQCSACPLNSQVGLKHPHMEPTGSDSPLIYVLGEAPGKAEDDKGEQFAGDAKKLLWKYIPQKFIKRVRWNNCVRTRPPKNRAPTPIEIECCRPSVVKDIEQSKPRVIFGLGGIPLGWATGLSAIQYWCGRKMPVQIGTHRCWFFPLYHPGYLARLARDDAWGSDGFDSEEEFAFSLHIKAALDSLEDLPKPSIHTKEKVMDGVQTIDGSGGRSDVRKVLKLFDYMASKSTVGIDYETNGLRPYAEDAKVLSAALASKRKSVAFAIDHRESGFSKRERATIKDAWKEFLEQSDCLKVAHNLPFELEWSIVMYGQKTLWNGKWGCSQSQAYVLDERAGAGALSLDGLCRQYFGFSLKAINPVDRADLDNVPLSDVLPYNAADSKYHRLLYLAQAARVESEGLLDEYYHNLERVAGISLMQKAGLPVKEKTARELEKKYTKIIKKVDSKLEALDSVKHFRKRRGRPFNAASTKDVKELFKNEGIVVNNVDEEVLKPLKGKAPRLILERRKATKQLSTYIVPALPGSPVLFGDRFHPIVSTTKTRTWRTSSDSPNSQNWPKYEGREVRRIVEPPIGYRVVAFDYSGIQARNVAMESRDKVLVDAFRHRYDIHTDWMHRIVKHYPRWMGGAKMLKDKAACKEFRQKAKNKFVFPSFFGAGAYTTSSGLGVPMEIGKALGKEFKRAFPGVAKWQELTRKNYRKTGYVTGLSGFRRRAPVAPTEIINTPIQSDESKIVLDALWRLAQLREDCFIPNIEIHDDLTFIWPLADIERNAEVVIGMMLDVPFEWAKIVPMGVEMSIGRNWADLEPVGEWFSDEWFGEMTSEERARIQ